MTIEEKKKFQDGLTLGLQFNNRLGNPYKVVDFINFLNPNNSWGTNLFDIYKSGYNKILILYNCSTNPDETYLRILFSSSSYFLKSKTSYSYYDAVGSTQAYYCIWHVCKDYKAPTYKGNTLMQLFASSPETGSFAPLPPFSSKTYISRIWSNCGFGEQLPFGIDEQGNVTTYTADTNYLNGFASAMAINFIN